MAKTENPILMDYPIPNDEMDFIEAQRRFPNVRVYLILNIREIVLSSGKTCVYGHAQREKDKIISIQIDGKVAYKPQWESGIHVYGYKEQLPAMKKALRIMLGCPTAKVREIPGQERENVQTELSDKINNSHPFNFIEFD